MIALFVWMYDLAGIKENIEEERRDELEQWLTPGIRWCEISRLNHYNKDE
jgi:hypothetical protein